MAVILATVDIEDLATAKVAGIKDALTDLVVSQQQIAAASGALTGSLTGSIASMQQAAQQAAALAQNVANLAQQFTASGTAAQQGLTGIEAYLAAIGEAQAAAAANREQLIQYVAVLGSLSDAATRAAIPLQAQAAALADLAQVSGVAGISEFSSELRAMADQLAKGVPLTEEQAAALGTMTVAMAEANRATLSESTALETLAQQAQATTAQIRDTYQGLTLLTQVLTEGTTVTKLQAEALAEMARTAAQGNGFTKEAAESFADLAESMQAGETVTKENAAALQQITTEYGETNAAALGLNDTVQESVSTFDQFKVAALAVSGVLVALGAAALAYAKQAAEAAARSEVLSVVLNTVGKNAHQGTLDMLIAVETIKKLGITSDEATEAVTKFINAELRVADAAKLARVAQDLAVIAGTNSSVAFERLTRAIEAQSAIMLRSFGIVTSLSKVYEDHARTLGKTGRELDDVEKKQAFLNKILEEGEKRAGTYEAAMEKTGKQYTSLDRLAEDLQSTIGSGLLPIFNVWVKSVTDLYNWFAKLSPEVQKGTTALLAFGAALALVGGAISGARLLGVFELFTKIGPAVRAATAAFTAARAGTVLLTGAVGTLGTTATAGVGTVTALGKALSVAFGGPWMAALSLLGVAIAGLTAYWVASADAMDSETQKAIEQTAATQGQIDKISGLRDALMDLDAQGRLTSDQQQEYNDKLLELKRLVPGVTTDINALTGAYQLNETAIADVIHQLEKQREMQAQAAMGTLTDDAIAYADALNKRVGLEQEYAALKARAAAADARQQAAAKQGITYVDAEAKGVRALIAAKEKQYSDAIKEEQQKKSIYLTNMRLAGSVNQLAEAEANRTDAMAEHKKALEDEAGGRAKLLKEISTLDIKDIQRDFKLFEEGMRFDPKLKMNVRATADEVVAAARRISKALEDQRDAARKLEQQEKAKEKAARKSVDDMLDVDRAEKARYERLNERLAQSGRGTEKWGQQVNDAKSLLMQFLHSVDFGTGKLGELEAGVRQLQFDKYLKLPEDTVIEYNALNAALVETTGNTDAYNAVLEANKGKIQAVNQMTAEQRAQIQANGEVIANATLQLQQYADEQLRIGQAEAGADAAKERLQLQQELAAAARDVTQEETDAARERRDAQIAADEAIRQSRLKLQDDIQAQRLEGQQLEAYRVRRQIEDLQHAFDLERQQRKLALDDQREANRQRIADMAFEIKARADNAIAAKKLDDDLTVSMLENAAMVKAAHGDKEAMTRAAADVARIREGNRIFVEGVRERQSIEEAAMRDTEARLNALVEARAKAEDQMTADQKKALDAQIANLQHYLSTLRLGLEVARQGWEGLKGVMLGIAGEFTSGLSEMIQGTKSFTTVMEDLWGSIKSAFADLVADMVKTWLQGLLKMALQAAQQKLLGSVMAGGAAAPAYASSGVDEAGAGLVAGGGGWGKGMTGSQKAVGAAGAAVVGGAVGYGVGRGTGSYAGGIAAGAGAGAAAGAQFGPWGALVGAGVGAVAGWLGARKARQQAEEERKKFIDSWVGGLDELKKKATEAGASLDDLNKAKTPEKVAEAVEELNKAFALQDAKESLGETYDGLRELQKQAQNLGYDLKRLYDAETIEEFNREQENLNKLLEEQQRRLEGLAVAAEGVNQWAEGFGKQLGQRFEEAFPDKERMNAFSTAFKEAVGKGYAGTIAEFSKTYQQELQKISFKMAQQGSKDSFKDAQKAGFKGTEEAFKKLQEQVTKAFGAGFKGTKAEYDRIMAEAVETSRKLGEVAKVSQSEFNALGTTAAATFAGMIKETGDLYGAMKAIEPTLNTLIQAEKEWGLQGDATFQSLVKFQRVIKDNEGIYQSLSGMTQALKGLSDAGYLTEESFDAIGRTATEKFDELNKKTGDHKMALLSVSPTLQALWEAQKKYGFSVDENTQKLIDQGIEQGTVGANMQSVNQKMLDVMGLIAQTLGVAKDKLVELGLVAKEPIIDPAAAEAAERLAAETEAAREEMERQRQAGIEAGTRTAEATEAARAKYLLLKEEADRARQQIAELGGAGITSGGQIDSATAEAIRGLELIILRAEEAERALRAMGTAGVTAGAEIEAGATGAAEGHSPTGIKQITFRVKEAEAALVSFSDLFAEKARRMETAAGSLSDMRITPMEDIQPVLKVAPGVQPTTMASGAVTVQVTQEGPVISVNALDNANMEEAWRTKIMPEYLKHIDNNADQLAERTENAISRHRRKVG